MTLLQDLYPPGELAAPPLAKPLHEPKEVSTAYTEDDRNGPFVRSKSRLSTATTVSRKRESYNLSGSTFLITQSGKTLRLPVPSSSENDPLNWSRRKTAAAILSIAWFAIMSSTAVQAPSVILLGIAAEFDNQDISPWPMEAIVTAPTLFIGLGALLWLPLSLGLGRRPVFLIVALMMPLAMLGAGLSRSFHQLLAFVCILGLGHGFSLTSAFLMVIDMTFIHQRTKVVALLWAISGSAGTGFLAVVPSMLPQIAWRQFYYYWSAPAAIAFILAFVLYPETYFKRPTVAFDGLILLQSATETLTVYKDSEGDSDLYRDLPDLPSGSSRSRFCELCHYLRLARSPIASWRSVGHCYLQMGYCAINPLIFWVVLASAIHWTSILFIGATYATVLQSPPYNMSSDSAQILNVNTSSAAGVLMAYPIGGWLIDKVLKRMTQRNNGVREAEHYLIGYIPPAVIGATGAIIYGFAVHHKLHFTLYYLACALEGLSWITMCITNTMWLTEAFPRWAAPAVAVSGGACYVLSFGIGFALMPWISAHGFKLVGVELAVLQIFAGLIVLPVAFWGKSARQAINGRWAGERSGALRPL